MSARIDSSYLGDTNSGLSAIPAKRLGVPVFHMEAGNRCYDDRVPEEVNRRIIDHASDVLMPYTERSRMNLIREGFAANRVFVIGNPIFESNHHADSIASSDVLICLGLVPKGYFLVRSIAKKTSTSPTDSTVSCVLSPSSVGGTAFRSCAAFIPARAIDLDRDDIALRISILNEPFGFFDFVALEQSASCVLSDSGTVQEECCIFGTPECDPPSM